MSASPPGLRPADGSQGDGNPELSPQMLPPAFAGAVQSSQAPGGRGQTKVLAGLALSSSVT